MYFLIGLIIDPDNPETLDASLSCSHQISSITVLLLSYDIFNTCMDEKFDKLCQETLFLRNKRVEFQDFGLLPHYVLNYIIFHAKRPTFRLEQSKFSTLYLFYKCPLNIRQIHELNLCSCFKKFDFAKKRESFLNLSFTFNNKFASELLNVLI
ncbi:hypothetical protein RF11_12756 [Thelohanellus kitauei]|uniref:Uncharacterized protein n=1 Tax=Thelohanellus kitauei TaxID=669202 RepID=A0A0C2IWV0_THEKT|nr:hypothetical protein RF11_12756 [Thelohanellus kitauei]